ncbi:MAG: thioredoxin domain-containing protein [Pseudomonadota bacterium]|jgi:protein-disulfide isomerase/uncharacterized membrane protein
MYRPASKLLTAVLSILGAGISSLALYEHVIYRYGLATGPSFCNISRHINCEAVNASDWSVFFGLPIAAYGLFFYVAVLGLLWVSGARRSVSDSQALQVIFVGGVLGSCVSLLLLGISEFIIGALCLLCVALYCITFLLLGVSWWGVGAGFKATFASGMRNILAFLRAIASGYRSAVAGLVSLALWAAVAATAPTLTHAFAKAFHGASSDTDQDDLALRDPVRAWREAPQVELPISVGAGVFGDYAKGDPQAPIQIVEFADFECPGCRVFYASLWPVLEKFKGQYHFVFKNYPLDSECNAGIPESFHQNACFAAYLTRCAGEQGRFWEALDYVFSDPLLEPDAETDSAGVAQVREALLVEGSKALGLDSQALRECVSSGRYLERVRQEVQQGDQLGLESTPSFWVNGRKVEHPTPDALEQIFTTILAERGQL